MHFSSISAQFVIAEKFYEQEVNWKLEVKLLEKITVCIDVSFCLT